ncbi:BnaCnng06960D [Brassica napus]|uniref:BnaCnng06960D protein n=1 Tax=Brassica napus TaxID=3708 RepID=A0A078H3W2_BRANA|nr:BnaCnng06960D [Brassica napus]
MTFMNISELKTLVELLRSHRFGCVLSYKEKK